MQPVVLVEVMDDEYRDHKQATESLPVEVVIFPLSLVVVGEAFGGISRPTLRKYAQTGLNMLNAQQIADRSGIERLARCILFCRLGAKGGRGNSFNPSAYADLELDCVRPSDRDDEVDVIDFGRLDAQLAVYIPNIKEQVEFYVKRVYEIALGGA